MRSVVLPALSAALVYNMTIRDLVATAWHIDQSRVSGGAPWSANDRYTIDGTFPHGSKSYDFTLDWGADDNAPSLFTVLEEQYGLRLVASKAALDYVVIESAEKPTDN